ncbi:hypothetical protein LUZ60_016911 [Juncus effusus]|nr:hypothetical protein LUZ60_016911 [Juncus effusus]
MESSSSFSSSFYDIYDLEAGISGETIATSYTQTHRSSNSNNNRGTNRSNLFCEPYEYEEEPQYFLDSCFLCKKLLSRNKDIFMYRGDTPFCSEDCRNEQIEIDEAREKGWKHSSNPSATKQPHKRQQKQGSQRIPVWAR